MTTTITAADAGKAPGPDGLDQSRPPDRVSYSTGMLLSAETFAGEQTYHRGRLARATAYLHGGGTAAGLEVSWLGADAASGREETLRVAPGLAVDRVGRLIEVPGLQCLRLARWYGQQDPKRLQEAFHAAPFGGVVADLYLRFAACPRDRAPSFAHGPFDSIDAVEPSRVRDGFALDLVPRPEGDVAEKVPADPWKGFAALNAADRRKAIYGAWHEPEEWAEGRPKPDGHPAGQDTTSVLLARIVLPAADAAPPTRTAAAVEVHDDLRRFVYPTAALAGLLGL